MHSLSRTSNPSSAGMDFFLLCLVSGILLATYFADITGKCKFISALLTHLRLFSVCLFFCRESLPLSTAAG